MANYNIVMATNESTVVAEYESNLQRSDAYQSEAALEKAFINLLTEQGYEYANHITDSVMMIANLRKQLEKLNHYTFSDKEWKRFFENNVANANEGIVEKTKKIQEDYLQILRRDDGSSKIIKLIDKENIHNNYLQVINQFVENSGVHDNRYDVTVLVNGLPLVHIELKRRGVALKEAFNQINRYQRESFWAGSGLYEYIQIFVISNGTNTKYYSNTTRNSHIKEVNNTRNKTKKTSNSFEFTSFWADANNKVINDLIDFTKTFFAKHSILNVLTRYCIFTSEKMLLVMRPYQIVATERIINRIIVSSNYKKTGTLEAGGYIWHTTGSGKTLTSFKTAQLASKLDFIDKVLFVVDRKDLDYQTIKEYDRFEKGAANSNRNTAVLQKQLEDTTSNIIVTTIQKLDVFISKNKTHEVYNKHVVLIFDECHRSQFGEMHKNIIKRFNNYHIFGFTGTPIFAANASGSGAVDLKTTEQAFGEKLHTYTIVDAINDKNVLPFRIDFINTIKSKDGTRDRQVAAIDTEEALQSPKRIEAIVGYILEHFDQKTKRNQYYENKGKRLNGFNSMFAVSSIPVAKKYYYEFKKQLAETNRDFTIATIFSFAANEEENADGILADESFDTENLDVTSRDFLDSAIEEYNLKFKTNFDTSSKGFQDYYKDLSLKVKEREIDLLIVVNMFLTGFDATTLNTLWVDKNLKQHGLIQAFSRTNRILNSVKSYGNIVCFRDLEKATNDAISLFGDKNASGIVLLKSYENYYFGYTDDKGNKIKGYEERIAELIQKYPLNEQIIGEKAKKEFVVLFGNILRLRNILSSFDKFAGEEILITSDLQNYTSIYLDIREEFKPDKNKESILDDVVFEMELVKQLEVNIDYILMLVAKYHESNCTDKEIIGAIDKAIQSSLELRSKKELIDAFIARLNTVTDVQQDWKKFVYEQKDKDMEEIIKNQNLKPKETRRFINNSFRDGVLKTTGTDLDKILPPVSMFSKNNNRSAIKEKVIAVLQKFFEKYFGLISPEHDTDSMDISNAEDADNYVVTEVHD